MKNKKVREILEEAGLNDNKMVYLHGKIEKVVDRLIDDELKSLKKYAQTKIKKIEEYVDRMFE